jgi:hypothetical protein
VDSRAGSEPTSDLAGGQPGQEALLLFLGAERLQRLRHPDRLVCREQGADRRVGRAEHHQRLAVPVGGQAHPAVPGVDLHAEGAEVAEAADDLVGDQRVTLDLRVVDVLGGERGGPAQELLEPGGAVRRLRRPRVDQVQPQPAEEQFLAEARLAPLGLASAGPVPAPFGVAVREPAGSAFSDLSSVVVMPTPQPWVRAIRVSTRLPAGVTRR